MKTYNEDGQVMTDDEDYKVFTPGVKIVIGAAIISLLGGLAVSIKANLEDKDSQKPKPPSTQTINH